MWATPTENFHKRCVYPLTQKVQPLHIALFFTFFSTFVNMWYRLNYLYKMIFYLFTNNPLFSRKFQAV